jgi:hypothetical protein
VSELTLLEVKATIAEKYFLDGRTWDEMPDQPPFEKQNI